MNSKKHLYNIRLNDYELQMIDELRKTEGKGIAQKIRNYIEFLYFQQSKKTVQNKEVVTYRSNGDK
jgi:hypothetical protein